MKSNSLSFIFFKYLNLLNENSQNLLWIQIIHFICVCTIIVYAETRQGVGSERMVHEHVERYRRRSFGGRKISNRRDVRELSFIWVRRKKSATLISIFRLICSFFFLFFLISGSSGFVTPVVLSRESIRWNFATRRKSRSHRSRILKFRSRNARE